MEDSSEKPEPQSSGSVECKKKREQKKKQKVKTPKSKIIVEISQESSSNTSDPIQNNTGNSQSRAKNNRRKIRKKTAKSDEVDGECLDPSPNHMSQNLLSQINDIFVHLNDMIISTAPNNVQVENNGRNIKNKGKSKNIYVSKQANMDQKIKRGKSVQSSPEKEKKMQGEKKRNKSVSDKHTTETQTKFEEYMSVADVTKGLQNGDLFSGCIRINPKDFKLSYVTNPNKQEQDVLIESLQDRNRALEGDVVVVKLKSESEWRAPNQKSGTVVHIKDKVHSRTAIGTLKLMPDKNKQFACFHPRDSRIPRIKIPFTDWPSLFYDEANQYEQVLFLGKITEWTDSRYAVGTILENVGMAGDIKTETKAILMQNCLDVSPFEEQMKQYFPKDGTIKESEYEYRLDLRKECVFTIDPLTARDLDDAVSCKELSNGNLEIGVHISDVSYYLSEGTPLDEIVAAKGTTVYMVESVYHMLPKELCMMCSLLPGEDKLAFSVFWEMTPEGEVIGHKFSRTIINSCTQLAYEHAQMMIENPDKILEDTELPTIHGGFKSEDLKDVVLRLQKIAVNLRDGRLKGGALRIDQPKVMFSLDPATCLPTSYSLYENKDSHRLIEEFMLLANITVATHLANEYPDIAFLRSHPAPHTHMMTALKTTLESVGIHLDVESAGGLQQTLWKYSGDDYLSRARMLVLSIMCAKPMTRAHYFCAANQKDSEEYWHYALNVPLYTHFTSPIRRYADIMVHRLLAGSLDYTEKPKWNVDSVAEIAANCNKQKFNAKRAGEQSIELYLIHYIGLHQPVVEKAVVMDVKDNSFDAIVISTGYNVRIYLNVSIFIYLCYMNSFIMIDLFQNLEENAKHEFLCNQQDKEDKKLRNLVILWPEKDGSPTVRQIIAMFSIITVTLTKKEKALKLEAKLVKPDT